MKITKLHSENLSEFGISFTNNKWYMSNEIIQKECVNLRFNFINPVTFVKKEYLVCYSSMMKELLLKSTKSIIPLKLKEEIFNIVSISEGK